MARTQFWRWLPAAIMLAAAAPVAAESRTEILINDTGVFPENLTSSRDGTVWIGSFAKGAIYRALPGAKTADLWISPAASGMTRAMGLIADEPRSLLWVCSAGERAIDARPAVPTSIKSFTLKTGELRASYPFEGGGGCNDMALAPDGTIYATDFDGGRVMRLSVGDVTFRPWAVEPGFGAADGVALLGDGAVYINTFRAGTLLRIPVKPDGSAGAATQIATDRPLVRPDGMRAVDSRTLLLVEGEGRLVRLTLSGETAKVHVLKDGLADSPAGVTLVGDTAFLVQAKFSYLRDPTKDPGRFSAIAVPYAPAK